MTSLQTFAPVLAIAFDTKPAAIYERQRALVRAELLPAPIGRGRGRGLPATPETVALMVIAMLVTENWSETDDRVRQVAEARFNGKAKRRSLFAGTRDFKSALAATLGSEHLPKDLLRVGVSRKDLTGFFEFGWASRPETTARFGKQYRMGKHRHMYRMYNVIAFVNAPALELIRKALHASPKQIARKRLPKVTAEVPLVRTLKLRRVQPALGRRRLTKIAADPA